MLFDTHGPLFGLSTAMRHNDSFIHSSTDIGWSVKHIHRSQSFTRVISLMRCRFTCSNTIARIVCLSWAVPLYARLRQHRWLFATFNSRSGIQQNEERSLTYFIFELSAWRVPNPELHILFISTAGYVSKCYALMYLYSSRDKLLGSRLRHISPIALYGFCSLFVPGCWSAHEF